MTANYVRLELADEKRGMYEYEVRFEPPKDSRDERFKLIGSMKEVFGPTKTSYKLESGPTLETFLAHQSHARGLALLRPGHLRHDRPREAEGEGSEAPAEPE